MKQYDYIIKPVAELVFVVAVAFIVALAQAVQASSFEAVYTDPGAVLLSIIAGAARVAYVVGRKGLAKLLVKIAGGVTSIVSVIGWRV